MAGSFKPLEVGPRGEVASPVAVISTAIGEEIVGFHLQAGLRFVDSFEVARGR